MMTTRKKLPAHEKGSGNIFADLGLPNAEDHPIAPNGRRRNDSHCKRPSAEWLSKVRIKQPPAKADWSTGELPPPRFDWLSWRYFISFELIWIK
jgi:hypothetical protein